jgi:AcrR family transcriptional regulator
MSNRTPGDAPTSRQAERSAATQRRLLDAARTLFAERGYADVSTEQLVRAAGVTRGAMYHQFADKRELFAALVEEIDAELAQAIGARALEHLTDPIGALRVASAAFLDAVEEPAIRQILLIDAPSVLGHARWREIGLRYGLGLVEQVLAAGMQAGVIAQAPTRVLAQVLVAAIDEAALMIADAEDPAAVRSQADEVIGGLLDGLRAM